VRIRKQIEHNGLYRIESSQEDKLQQKDSQLATVGNCHQSIELSWEQSKGRDWDKWIHQRRKCHQGKLYRSSWHK